MYNVGKTVNLHVCVAICRLNHCYSRKHWSFYGACFWAVQQLGLHFLTIWMAYYTFNVRPTSPSPICLVSMTTRRRTDSFLSAVPTCRQISAATQRRATGQVNYRNYPKFERVLNPLYTGGLFHCHMLDESIVILGVSGLF